MARKTVIIGEKPWGLPLYREVVLDKAPIRLSPSLRAGVDSSRKMVENILADNRRVYGISTGFGSLAQQTIPPEDLEQLQSNLILSHCVGVGPRFSPLITRGILFLRLLSLLGGYSGVRWEIFDYFVRCLNRDIMPLIPEQGSVGASGDLAPLAEMVAVFMGHGNALVGDTLVSGTEALQAAGLKPLRLVAKEGLALINGTCAMTAVGINALLAANNLLKCADLAAALSLEALKGSLSPFDPHYLALRPHPGQAVTGENIRRLLANSAIMDSHKNCGKVQDAYSLRCVPQVHGASRDSVSHVTRVLTIELGSVTDNPILMPERDRIISGGHFHGQPVALAMDFLGIAMAEIGSISERRVDRLMNPAISGLPPFLVEGSGLNSGLMLTQYCAAALVSENKVLAHPASVDSIPTSAYQEDHVSMGTIAARKARDIIENVSQVLAIEILCACQGLDLVRPLLPGVGTGAALKFLRRRVPFLARDRYLGGDIRATAEMVKSGALVDAVEKAVGPLGEGPGQGDTT